MLLSRSGSSLLACASRSSFQRRLSGAAPRFSLSVIARANRANLHRTSLLLAHPTPEKVPDPVMSVVLVEDHCAAPEWIWFRERWQSPGRSNSWVFALSQPCLLKYSSVAWACSPLIQRAFELVVTRVKHECQYSFPESAWNGKFTMPERIG
jgi:hypothetical protein